jgi:hypothetical protein
LDAKNQKNHLVSLERLSNPIEKLYLEYYENQTYKRLINRVRPSLKTFMRSGPGPEILGLDDSNKPVTVDKNICHRWLPQLEATELKDFIKFLET